MYRHLSKEKWLKVLRLQEEQIPDGLIIYGFWDVNEALSQWRYYLSNAKILRMHNILSGQYIDKEVVIAVTYGAPMTAEIVHIFSAIETKIIIHVGWFGGLQKNINLNKILLPTEAFRGESVSDLYLQKGEKADATLEIVNWIFEKCLERGLSVHKGKILTTISMFAETWEDVVKWHRAGWIGVDLETATTFAVAKSFNIPRAAILSLGDHLINKKDAFSASVLEKRQKDKIRREMFTLALDTVNHFS